MFWDWPLSGSVVLTAAFMSNPTVCLLRSIHKRFWLKSLWRALPSSKSMCCLKMQATCKRDENFHSRGWKFRCFKSTKFGNLKDLHLQMSWECWCWINASASTFRKKKYAHYFQVTRMLNWAPKGCPSLAWLHTGTEPVTGEDDDPNSPFQSLLPISHPRGPRSSWARYPLVPWMCFPAVSFHVTYRQPPVPILPTSHKATTFLWDCTQGRRPQTGPVKLLGFSRPEKLIPSSPTSVPGNASSGPKPHRAA